MIKIDLNNFFKLTNICILLNSLFILTGLLMALLAGRTELIFYLFMYNIDTVSIQWYIISLLLTIELVYYKKGKIRKSVFITSIIIAVINFYLVYLCMFIHTPNGFDYNDFLYASRRFFYLPISFFDSKEVIINISTAILVQLFCLFAGFKIKIKKKLKGVKVNILSAGIKTIVLYITFLITILLIITMSLGREVEIDIFNLNISLLFLSLACLPFAFIIEFLMDAIIEKQGKATGDKWNK